MLWKLSKMLFNKTIECATYKIKFNKVIQCIHEKFKIKINITQHLDNYVSHIFGMYLIFSLKHWRLDIFN